MSLQAMKADMERVLSLSGTAAAYFLGFKNDILAPAGFIALNLIVFLDWIAGSLSTNWRCTR
jgi:hypothetical protein